MVPIADIHELEIPHGPCASFSAPMRCPVSKELIVFSPTPESRASSHAHDMPSTIANTVPAKIHGLGPRLQKQW